MGLLKRLFGKSANTYTSIDNLPMWNWIKCHEETTTKYVFKAEDYENIKENKDSFAAYSHISDEMFNQFGFTDKFKTYINAKKRIVLKKLDAYLKDNRSLLTIAKLEELELRKKYEEGNKDIDYWDVIANLEQSTGLVFDVKTISVKKFYKHLNLHIHKQSLQLNGKKANK